MRKLDNILESIAKPLLPITPVVVKDRSWNFIHITWDSEISITTKNGWMV